MPALPQYTYIFVLGLGFAFLDAWNIGANDVANSFATSVSSRSLTLMQAMAIASVCEFAGAVLVGNRVSDTIRNKVISVSDFEAEPSVLMLGMLCALIGSSSWLTVATRIGLPVSTTHCIVGGIIGVGFATIGAGGVQWGWKGVAQIFAAWGIAPAIAAGFAAIVFLITEFTVLRRKDPLRAGLQTMPLYFALTTGVMTMVIVWKGAPSLNLDELSTGQTVGAIFGVAGGFLLLSWLFFVPYFHRLLVMDDWTLKWYDAFYGPLLYRRGPVPPPPHGEALHLVQDYYRGHATRDDLAQGGLTADDIAIIEQARRAEALPTRAAGEKGAEGSRASSDIDAKVDPAADGDAPGTAAKPSRLAVVEGRAWYHPRRLAGFAWAAFMHGVRKDVVESQNKPSSMFGNIAAIHAHAARFDNKTEHLYSFLQVLTAATASFAHGANDLSNAVGPLSTIYLVWNTGTLASKAPVPIWVLVFGASAIVIGLWTYGYNIMRNLGNRITLMSPTRGFSMELGAALTIILATRLALPVSTTQCIVGAIMGVALCNRDYRALNWRMVAWCYMGWFITLPIAATIAGVLMAIIINAPRWGMST